MVTPAVNKQASASQLGPGNVQRAPYEPPGRHRFVSLFGMQMCDDSIAEVADILVTKAVERARFRGYFVNAHCVNVAARDAAYRTILQHAPYVFADGVGMAIAGRMLGHPLMNNVNGTDLMPALCRRAARRGIPMALLGSRPGTASACAYRLQAIYPGLDICWVGHGFLSENNEAGLLPGLNASGARILLVAKGVPRQEKWINRYAPLLDIPVILGVGALFDFYSGRTPRAPLLMRRMRMEWVFRLLLEPRRLAGRYLTGNPLFVARVIRARAGGIAFPGVLDVESESQDHG